jgi:uncharacterized protein YbjT (DUF2867 family)
MSEIILVLGGTGRLGEPVARKLAASGHRVRVLSRQKEAAEEKLGPGFEVAQGDVGDLASLERALAGCTGAHLSLDGRGDWDVERRGAENVARIGARAGLKQVTLTSGASACEENAWFPMTRAKLDAENAIRTSGVPFTILRCTMFMETLPAFVRDGKAMVMGHQPIPWRFAAADDYAAMVAKAYATPAARGKILYVYGPEALTMEQAVEQYRALCVPEAKLVRVPFWMLSLIALFPGRAELRRVGLPLMRYFSRVREVGDAAEADALLGKPTTTLTEWCRARAATKAKPA